MRIGLDDLSTYAVFSLTQSGKEATFENLVARCFELFPQRFALVGYPNYPDATVVNNSCWRCRSDRHWIEGSAAKGFKVTASGLNIVEKVARLLKTPTTSQMVSRAKEETRSRASKFLRHIAKSEAYKKYLLNPVDPKITDFELRDLLLGTLQTEPEILLENVAQFIEYATIKPDANGKVLDFLGYVKKEVSIRFVSLRTKRQFVGGMKRRLS